MNQTLTTTEYGSGLPIGIDGADLLSIHKGVAWIEVPCGFDEDEYEEFSVPVSALADWRPDFSDVTVIECDQTRELLEYAGLADESVRWRAAPSRASQSNDRLLADFGRALGMIEGAGSR